MPSYQRAEAFAVLRARANAGWRGRPRYVVERSRIGPAYRPYLEGGRPWNRLDVEGATFSPRPYYTGLFECLGGSAVLTCTSLHLPGAWPGTANSGAVRSLPHGRENPVDPAVYRFSHALQSLWHTSGADRDDVSLLWSTPH
jgi:hypothetical protein